MPRGTDGTPVRNDAVVMRDAFRACAYKIGIEAHKIDAMIHGPLWRAGTKNLPRPAYDDLRAARTQLNEACAAIDEILAATADREEAT